MNPVTVQGMTPANVANQLMNYRYAYVELEPGDVTNYKLHVIRDDRNNGLIVTRETGGHDYMTTFLSRGFGAYEINKLTFSHNDWTCTLLTWYFRILFSELNLRY